MSSRRSHPAPAHPGLFVFLGVMVTGFGCATLFDREGYNAPVWLGPFLFCVGGPLILIGVISAGVSMGIRRAESFREPSHGAGPRA